jgi:hypothetical protein
MKHLSEAALFYLNCPGREYALRRKSVPYMQELHLIENIQTSAKMITSGFESRREPALADLLKFLDEYELLFGDYPQELLKAEQIENWKAGKF